MDLQEAVFDKKAVHEEHGTQKLKVAKLEEQNLEKTGDSSRTRPWIMLRMSKPEVWNATPEY